MASPKEMAICHVIKNGTTLLIKAEEGLNKDKWNAPSDELATGERPDKAAMRSVFQQTGLYVSKVFNHGTIRLFLNGKVEYDYKMHVYSTKLFSGDLKPNIQGEPRWFGANELPFYEMWADDKYWVNLVLEGKKFDADFFLDEKNENVVKYQIRERKETLRKALPIIIILAVIAVLIYGIVSSGILNQAAKPPTAFKPGSTSTTSSTSITTSATTTIAAPQVIPPPPVTQGTITNKTYIYYIYYSGSPPQAQTYYAIGSSTGISNWQLLQGVPVEINNADCSVYNLYTYCTSSVPLSNSTGTVNSTPTKVKQNAVRIGNPVCLALKPSNPDICYNTYYTNSTTS